MNRLLSNIELKALDVSKSLQKFGISEETSHGFAKRYEQSTKFLHLNSDYLAIGIIIFHHYYDGNIKDKRFTDNRKDKYVTEIFNSEYLLQLINKINETTLTKEHMVKRKEVVLSYFRYVISYAHNSQIIDESDVVYKEIHEHEVHNPIRYDSETSDSDESESDDSD